MTASIVSNHVLFPSQMLFDWLIAPCVDFVIRQCRELVRTSPMRMVKSMLTMYSILLDELR